MSRSFESVQWNACVHRLDLGLYSHPKRVWGNGVRTHVKSEGKIPWNPRRCTKQDSEPNTLSTSYSGPQNVETKSLLAGDCPKSMCLLALGGVQPLQDVPLHQCLPLLSV